MSPKKKLSRSEIRELMPLSTAHVDWVRKEFGEPVYIKAQENGHSIEWGEDVIGRGPAYPAVR